jgi:signal transduction histidine kinase
VAFLLVAGLSAAALAVGSYALVRTTRLQDSLRRAESDARFNLLLAADTHFAEGRPDPAAFVSQYELRGVHAALVVDGRTEYSDPSVAPPIPQALRSVVSGGLLGFARVRVGGTPYLFVGGRPPGSDGELYFLLSEEQLHADLKQLAVVLAAGVGGIVVVAGLVGRSLSRRTLEPVARASRAARLMAEGRLETRLPSGDADEFGTWAASFNQMADALETKIAALSEAQARERRFTSDVAHELRTPLTALVGEASLLGQHLDVIPLQARRPAELVLRDVARLRRLVDELMEISRLDAGSEALRPEPVDVPALVHAILRSRGWASAVEVEAEPLIIPTDPRRLERVLANLLGNAIEHGGHDVSVSVEHDSGHTRISVTDQGPGIPPEHLPHVFDRFFKVDPARSGPGSGLGLSIARENAVLLGGRLEGSSEPGAGTRFTLHLTATERLHAGESRVAGEADDEAQV